MPSMSPVPDIGQVSDFSTAISGLVGTVLLVIAGVAWIKAKAWFTEVITDVKATKVQTTNSHETNMRDDLTEAIDLAKALVQDVGEMKEDLRDVRKDVRFAIEYTREVDKRVYGKETELAELIAWGKMRMRVRQKQQEREADVPD